MTLLKTWTDRVRHLMTRQIWLSEVLGDRSLRGRSFAALRVVWMTWSGLVENRLASRAGALSYSSMLGIVPLIALITLFSGAVLETNDPNFVGRQLNRALEFIAPQIRQLQEVAPAPGAEGISVNPELVETLNTLLQGTQSKAIGIMGSLALILIVIQLFSAIENAFNDVWGVRRGRNWMLRIVYYWASVSLGAVLVFASLTLLSASTFINMIESLPLGPELRRFFVFAGPAISMGVLACVFTTFYKFIPNTSVGWRPAFAGALTVVALLNLNNYLAFLYLRQVIFNQSLYGSLALPAVLMVGLYVFWLFLLVGGQITYAVQNANYRSSNMAWHDLNHTSREGIALLVLTVIARRFRECRQAFSTPEISDLIKIPTQVLNACLERLMRLGLVSRIPSENGSGTQEHRFQPARPLDRVTLAEFKASFESLGDGPARTFLDSLDPVVRVFHRRLEEATHEALGSETLESLIGRLSGDAPPAATETIGTVRVS